MAHRDVPMGHGEVIDQLGSLARPVDFCRGYRNSVMFMQNLVCIGRKTVDPDQIVLGLAARHAFLEELLDRLGLRDLDRVGETAAVVIEIEHLHDVLLIEKGKENKGWAQPRWRPTGGGHGELLGREGEDGYEEVRGDGAIAIP